MVNQLSISKFIIDNFKLFVSLFGFQSNCLTSWGHLLHLYHKEMGQNNSILNLKKKSLKLENRDILRCHFTGLSIRTVEVTELPHSRTFLGTVSGAVSLGNAM